MALRDVGRTGWALLTATIVAAAALLALALAGFPLTPPRDLVFASLSIGLPILTILTVWYFYDVVWAREIRRRRVAESSEVPAMATAEVLLRLMDHAQGLLDRLTRYTGWFFFLILLTIFVVPALFSLNLIAWAAGSILLTSLFGIVNVAFWIAYFYYYYKIKHENDIWKERIRWLRERERVLLER